MYVLHYRNLQLHLDLGLKLKKGHCVIEFDQSPWLKQYIDFNTQKRTNAKNSFDKDFFKLMNNSVYGRTLENVWKRVDVRLVTDEKKLIKLASIPICIKYGSKAKLLFTDTDSLTYEITAEDVYKDFWNNRSKFDNSDYPEQSPYFDKTNKKVIGVFKDEAAGIPVIEFVGLRSKMYSYVKDDGKGSKPTKGITKVVIKKDIKYIYWMV